MDWRRAVLRVAAIAFAIAGCAASPPASEPATQDAPPQPPAAAPRPETPSPPPSSSGTQTTPLPATPRTSPSTDAGQAGPAPPLLAWERQAGDARENRGVAKVERIGPRWMLTVMCNGTHSTYLDDTTIDLEKYSKGYVSARYRWVTRMVRVQCVRAPCPEQPERRLAIERLTAVDMTDARASELAKNCGDGGF